MEQLDLLDDLSENTHTITLTVTDEVVRAVADPYFYTVGTPHRLNRSAYER